MGIEKVGDGGRDGREEGRGENGESRLNTVNSPGIEHNEIHLILTLNE